jgi:hypothetical protein
MTIAHDAHPSTEDHDDTVEAHYASLERPCACNEGFRLHRPSGRRRRRRRGRAGRGVAVPPLRG